MLKSFRSLSLATALMGTLVFVAACSGPSNSLSPTSPSGIASAAAAGSAVSGAMSDEVPPPECDPKSEKCEPPPPECDPKTEKCEPPPPPPGDEGCTPGYWKNHLDSWAATGYAPDMTLQSIFGGNALAGSLLDGLNFGGGGGVAGAKQILLRAAVAALLNSAHPDVDYTRTTGAVIAAVQTALNSGDRATMLALATALDIDNNLGCPLS